MVSTFWEVLDAHSSPVMEATIGVEQISDLFNEWTSSSAGIALTDLAKGDEHIRRCLDPDRDG